MNSALSLLLLFSSGQVADQNSKPVLVSARKIWDAAPHNAFTDLVRHNGRWYCVFREGQGHVSPDGALRVISSEDGKKWRSAALIESETSDLRDAKITVTPKGQLMLSGAEAVPNADHKHQSLVWLSWDGLHWSKPRKIGDKDYWLWRTTWNPSGTALGFGYGTKARGLRLYSTRDGKRFDTLIEKVDVAGTYPNETSIVFEPDGTARCLLRHDGQPNHGMLGESKPPYREWSWKSLGVRIGGPHMVRLPDGRYFACVRLYDQQVRTALCELDVETAKLTEILKLPSGGDTSYAGLVWHEEQLWISYYSSHEGKTSIYLAKAAYDSGFWSPWGANAVSQGSFTAWSDPAKPAERQPYTVTVEIRLPYGLKTYRLSDFSGKLVGTDRFQQRLPWGNRVKLKPHFVSDGRKQPLKEGGSIPVHDGKVQICFEVPGATRVVRDELFLQSKLLQEERSLELDLVFGAPKKTKQP